MDYGSNRLSTVINKYAYNFSIYILLVNSEQFKEDVCLSQNQFCIMKMNVIEML